MSKSKTATYFYFGTFLSSVGSMTLAVCLVAFMLKEGFSLLKVSIIIGLSRFLPVLISTFIRQKVDSLSPKHTIIFTEIGAALASMLLFFSWEMRAENYYIILTTLIIKSGFTSFQTGSVHSARPTLV